MNKIDVGAVRSVVTDLHKMEQAIDDAMRQCATVMVSMIDSSRAMGLAAPVGHKAYVGAVTTLSRLADSRTNAIELHAELKDIHGAIKRGDVVQHGDLWKLVPAGSASPAAETEHRENVVQLEVAA